MVFNQGLLVILLTIVYLTTFADAADSPWSYTGVNGTSKWGNLFPTCSASYQKQSPINIATASVNYNSTLDEIKFNVQQGSPNSAKVYNNGHTAEIEFDTTIRVSGGNLGTNAYSVVQAHFHWGKTDSNGSEHTIDSQRYPLETHIVMYDSQTYQTADDASTETNGLAVVSAFFKISGTDNEKLAPLITALSSIVEPASENKIPIQQFPIDSLLPANRSKYFRYSGSLTTPGCYESVIWTVMNDFQYISSNQLAEFRKLYAIPQNATIEGAQTLLAPNFRPLQQLNGRTVSVSFKEESSSNFAIKLSISLLSMLFVICSTGLHYYMN